MLPSENTSNLFRPPKSKEFGFRVIVRDILKRERCKRDLARWSGGVRNAWREFFQWLNHMLEKNITRAVFASLFFFGEAYIH